MAKGPGARQGRSNSLKWPWLYDKLVAKGYDHSKAAAISNSRIGMRKKGRISVLTADQAHSSKVLKRLAANDKARKHSTKKMLISAAYGPATSEFACYSAACAPPKGGSLPGGRGGKGSTAPKGSGAPKKEFQTITKAEARGDSRPVSHEEFQRLAADGQSRLDKMAANSSPHAGLDKHWDELKASTFDETKKSWGGATIDSHTGQVVPQGANKFALTVKAPGLDTVSVPEGASRAQFDKAMDLAKTRFSAILQREGHHLGVFHDDEHNRIDFDPVIVTSKHSDVETIGAATRAIGGAYNFKDGNGYWPPHVV